MAKIHIHPAIAPLEGAMIDFRRYLHQHPELGFQEEETARYILARLDGLGLEVRHPVARTGIVAVLRNGDGPCIALRADMDALPIQETSDLPYKSVNEGVMHACGHDGHTAILLGTLMAIQRHTDLWRGTVKFIFQPAEEGDAGAERMVREGVLRDPVPAAVFGLHLWNHLPVGAIGVQAGPVTAAADAFEITVRGKGGHGARPQDTVDAVHVAAQLVVALQSVVSRNLNPLDPGVVTIGKIQGGYNFNVIADKVDLLGTARSYSDDQGQLIRDRLQAICDGLGAAYGARIELGFRDGYPPTVNDPAMTDVAARAARAVAGDGAGEFDRAMVGEDMSYFLREVPGCFFFVGSAKPDADPDKLSHHSPHFDFDERALATGASVFVNIVTALLPRG